jgi:hypothetical protein
MSLKFPISVSRRAVMPSTCYGDRHYFVAFSSAARALAYLSAHVTGQLEVELISAQRFLTILPELYAQQMEMYFDPVPNGRR